MGVSVPTLQRLEAGDPAVGLGLGIVATAPWLIRRDGELGNLAAPEHDQGAIELDVREAVKPGGRRRLPRSVSAQAGQSAAMRLNDLFLCCLGETSRQCGSRSITRAAQ